MDVMILGLVTAVVWTIYGYTVLALGKNIFISRKLEPILSKLFPTRCTQGLEYPPTVGSGGYILGTIQGQPPK